MPSARRIPVLVLLAALGAPLPLAAGNTPARPAHATRTAKGGGARTPAPTPLPVLALLALMLGHPTAGAATEPAPTGSGSLVTPTERVLDPYLDACPTHVPESFYQQSSHCTVASRPAVTLDGEAAAQLAEAMNLPQTVEEVVAGADRRIQDLRDCVCRAMRAHRSRFAPDTARYPVLLERLEATEAQRQALRSALGEAWAIKKQCWNRLARDLELWHIAEADDERPADPMLENPWPERIEQLNAVIEQLERADREYDSTVKGYRKALKRKLKARSR